MMVDKRLVLILVKWILCALMYNDVFSSVNFI